MLRILNYIQDTVEYYFDKLHHYLCKNEYNFKKDEICEYNINCYQDYQISYDIINSYISINEPNITNIILEYLYSNLITIKNYNKIIHIFYKDLQISNKAIQLLDNKNVVRLDYQDELFDDILSYMVYHNGDDSIMINIQLENYILNIFNNCKFDKVFILNRNLNELLRLYFLAQDLDMIHLKNKIYVVIDYLRRQEEDLFNNFDIEIETLLEKYINLSP
jgi:hypothetical protein